MYRKRITNSKTLYIGSWVIGYGHHLGDDAVEISNNNNKERKEDEVQTRKRANEKIKKFDDDVKRVLTEPPPEKWTSQGYFLVDDLNATVRWFRRHGDLKCTMKKGELWERWEETKGRSEHDRTCLDTDEEIATIGSTPIKTTGQKTPEKCRCLPGNTTTSQTKKGQPKDDNPPFVARVRPKRSTQRQG
jgi:hypothetical protein